MSLKDIDEAEESYTFTHVCRNVPDFPQEVVVTVSCTEPGHIDAVVNVFKQFLVACTYPEGLVEQFVPTQHYDTGKGN